jgi:hypothetical protein
MKLILLALILATAAIAQTKAAPVQVSWPASTEPMLAVILPTGIAFIKIDPATLVYDAATNTLRAKLPAVIASTPLVFSTELLTGSGATWTLPVGCTPIAIYRNGVLQHYQATPPTQVDYSGGTATVRVVTFKPTSQPQAGDVVSALCAR